MLLVFSATSLRRLGGPLKKIGIDRDLVEYDVNLRVMSLTPGEDAADLGMAFCIALLSATLGRAIGAQLVVLGPMSLRGVLSRVEDLGDKLRVAMGAGARRVLIPTENSRDFAQLPAEVLDKLRIAFYSEPSHAAFEASAEWVQVALDVGSPQDRATPGWVRWVDAVRDARPYAGAVTDHNTAIGIRKKGTQGLFDARPGGRHTSACRGPASPPACRGPASPPACRGRSSTANDRQPLAPHLPDRPLVATEPARRAHSCHVAPLVGQKNPPLTHDDPAEAGPPGQSQPSRVHPVKQRAGAMRTRTGALPSSTSCASSVAWIFASLPAGSGGGRHPETRPTSPTPCNITQQKPPKWRTATPPRMPPLRPPCLPALLPAVPQPLSRSVGGGSHGHAMRGCCDNRTPPTHAHGGCARRNRHGALARGRGWSTGPARVESFGTRPDATASALPETLPTHRPSFYPPVVP